MATCSLVRCQIRIVAWFTACIKVLDLQIKRPFWQSSVWPKVSNKAIILLAWDSEGKGVGSGCDKLHEAAGKSQY